MPLCYLLVVEVFILLSRNLLKIEVFSYQPPEANARTPIVFVLTGLNRDADKYRDDWVENARKNKLIVIAPHFSQQDYPGSDGYNLGNIINSQTGKLNPQGEWAFSVIDSLFAEMQKQGITQQKAITCLAIVPAVSLSTAC